ncbi:Mobile element protein [Candidatus Synechococcus spongiarum]|uniref:Mobile element protein n=1 Tax=Candidatus Synechococcus spongiarum TaxID=431041 RepID=A0A170TEA6_9SYNE|nr:Mobile element protein [Candidatus Synechococcus spongiarum]
MEGATHDYTRNDITTLFIVLDIATGKILAQYKYRYHEFFYLLQHIDKNVPNNLDIHLIIDNDGTHKHAKLKE